MSIELERLQYLNETHTQTWISQQTGIPQSTLSYVLREQRELPQQYYSGVLTTYMTNTAYRMSDAGLPVHQVPRFQVQEPEIVRSVTAYVNDTAMKLAEGYVIKQAYDQDIPDSQVQSYINDNISDAVQYIRDSLRRSEKPIEEWEDYPTKYSDYIAL